MPDGFFSLNNPNFLDIMMRFAINLFFLFILIKVVYFRYTKKEKFLFTFFLMGIVVFFICSMLRSVFIEFGMAVGLFAVFAILRFRTRNFSIKDMAYIFTSIGVSLINSLKLLKFPLLGVLIINGIIILAAYLLEEFILKHSSESYIITYENMDLLRPDKKQKLLKDVSAITGKQILKVKIRRVDYKREVARLEIYYRD
jgi:hypothetical protein